MTPSPIPRPPGPTRRRPPRAGHRPAPPSETPARPPAPPPPPPPTTRADLLDAVAATCPSLARAQARDIFEMALDEVSEALVRGESVKLRSFGLFAVREKRERVGRNPRTGIEVPIKPRRVLTFKPSPVLLDAVNRRVGPAGTRGED